MLGEIAQPTRPRARPEDFPSLTYVGLEHVESETMRLIGSSPTRKISSTCTKFENGDVLYARMRPNLNKVWVADREGLCSTEFIVFPRSPDLNSKFLGFRLNSPDFVAFAVQQVAGDRPRVSFEQIATFELEIPPLGEQDRIVTKLEEKLAQLRRGLANLDRAQARLLDYHDSVESAAVTGKLRLKHKRAKSEGKGRTAEELKRSIDRERIARHARDRSRKSEGRALFADSSPTSATPPDTLNAPTLPTDWTWGSIDELSWDAGYGTSTKCTTTGTGPPVLRIPNVQSGKIDTRDLKFAVDADGVRSSNLIARGDLLIIRTNGSKELVGRSALVKVDPVQPTGFASYLIRFRLLGDPRFWDWVTLVWNSRVYRPILQGIASTTAGQYNVSVSSLRSFPVPIAPTGLQLDLLYEVDQRLAIAARMAERISQQMTRAREQRQSLLVSAFTGEFVEQLDRDEPASVLIDRLKEGLDIALRLLREATLKSKSRDKSKRAAIKPLYETLQNHGAPMSAEDLFAKAGFAAAFKRSTYDQSVVDDFYEKLHGLLLSTPGIRIIRPDSDTVLLEATP